MKNLEMKKIELDFVKTWVIVSIGALVALFIAYLKTESTTESTCILINMNIVGIAGILFGISAIICFIIYNVKYYMLIKELDQQ